MARAPRELTDEELQQLTAVAFNVARGKGCDEEESKDVAAVTARNFYLKAPALEWPQMINWVATATTRDAFKLLKKAARFVSLNQESNEGWSLLGQLPAPVYEDPDALEFVQWVMRQMVLRCQGKCGRQAVTLEVPIFFAI